MSWNVADEAWLAWPGSGAAPGPIDALDERVLSAFWVTEPAAEPVTAESTAPVSDAAHDAAAGGVPPPPHSAAFDEHHERPSWESGSYAADPEQPDEEQAPQSVPPPDGAAPDAEPTESPDEDAPGFHIPALSLSAQPPAPEPVATPPETEQGVGADQTAPEDAGFVIPTLSRPVAPVAAPTPAHAPVLESAVADPGDQATPHEDQLRVGAPEVLERVDSSELELLADDDEDLDAAEAGAEEPFAGFVIPMLARPEPSPPIVPSAPLRPEVIVAESPAEATLTEAAASPEPAELRGGSRPVVGPPVVGSGANAVVIPSLTRAEPAAPPPRPPVTAAEAEAEDAEIEAEDAEVEAEDAEIEAEEADETLEAEGLEVENLDSADLEEVDHPAPAVDAEEVKPPTPPEAKPQPKRRKAWYDDVFAEHFLALFPTSWEETAARDAEFIHAQLGLPDGANVLDVGCGEGGHAVQLAKLGLRVTGVDNSLALLLAAAQNKELAGIEDDSVVFMHGDMRRLPRDREFDAVVCVGSTFGYFEEEQNRLCLQEMVERLPVGGKLLLHVFNRDFVAPQLPSRSWWQGKRCMVIDEAEMNFFANRLRIHRTIIFDDGRQHEHYMFMRAYTVQDLGKAMSQIGLRVIEVSGSRDTRGRFYGSASPDIWMLAERK
ncbi:methyltransferase domain-containing protein [Enhygromyxa salina]|uniref:Glycine/sarcosine N-methyltransferase n=1 Tax=Enhygromyxa salina TaxID=215803 RepID=A0A2S9YRR5_9BACT|nr:methyltransferase domain-containing protein [Enhygromyxa salina]PRQ07768.1 Glycine/sarcosine N-methyltransferase [Enhygromyxa salina]